MRAEKHSVSLNSRSEVRVHTGLALAVLLCATPVLADTASDVRYTDLLARLGASAPTGAGIGVGQVEANEGSNFAPDQAVADFAGTSFVVSGTSGNSWHATEVGKALYGNSLSIAPGITNVWCWSASPFVTSSYLKLGSGSAIPPISPPTGLRVFNHSWIGSFGSTGNDNDALRRLDFTVNRDNLTIVAGVNNGAGSAGQPMMAYAFNGLAVGLPNGAHSNSLTPTGIDGPNRRKPDIVAPRSIHQFRNTGRRCRRCAPLGYRRQSSLDDRQRQRRTRSDDQGCPARRCAASRRLVERCS